MADDETHPSEAGLLAPDRREPLQTFARLHFARLGRLAERVNVGHLVQAHHLRLAFGQGHALARAVVQRDEDGRRESHDPRFPHAVSRRRAAQEQFHLRRLLTAGEIALAQPEHELEEHGRVGRCGLARRCGRWGFRVHGEPVCSPPRHNRELLALGGDPD